MAATSVVSNARARAHAAVRADITGEARRQLAVAGAASLSLRAVARELGMASSAMYRYFTSRDELLTALIVEGYDAMGEVAFDMLLDAIEANVIPNQTYIMPVPLLPRDNSDKV